MPDYWYPTAFSYWGEEERAAIQSVIASGRFTMGPQVEAFEQEFAKYHNIQHAIMVNSGSSANLVAVAALCSKYPRLRGAKVAVPAIAWATTYAPLVQFGFDLVVTDADDTWCSPPSPEDVEVEIACSVLGNPDYLTAKANQPRITLEDNCESLGARHNDELCGTYGYLNTFSFFYSHQLSAIEGGMILTRDAELSRLCRMIRDHGMTRSVHKAGDFDQEYDFRYMGYNVRPLEMHAAIAREQLKKLDEFRYTRSVNEGYFCDLTKHLPIKMQRENGLKSPFGIAFRLQDNDTRRRLVAEFRRNGIDCRLPTGGSFLQHVYAQQWATKFETPVADAIHNTALFIGNAPYPIPRHIEKAVEVIKQVIG